MVTRPSTQAGQGLVTVPTGHSDKPHNFRRPGAQSSQHSRLSSVAKIWILHQKDGCESWTIKKAERQRIGAFELWCCGRLLRVPWNSKRSKQSILKEMSPEYSWDGLMLKLKLQYFGHLVWRTNSFEKTLMQGKTEGRRKRGQPRTRWLDGITNSMDMNFSTLQEWVMDREVWYAALHRAAKSWTRISNWIDWTDFPSQFTVFQLHFISLISSIVLRSFLPSWPHRVPI